MADEFKEFDEVQVVNESSIRWLFTGMCPVEGKWLVVSVVGDQLVLSRGQYLIRIPMLDVRKVTEYSTSALLDHMKRMSGYG